MIESFDINNDWVVYSTGLVAGAKKAPGELTSSKNLFEFNADGKIYSTL